MIIARLTEVVENFRKLDPVGSAPARRSEYTDLHNGYRYLLYLTLSDRILYPII